MKTRFVVLVGIMLIGVSLSAQNNSDSKPGKVKSGQFPELRIFGDSLNLNVPFNADKYQSPLLKNGYRRQSRYVAINEPLKKSGFSNIDKMPIVKPGFTPRMPVARPDSSVVYFLGIQKIGK